MPARLPVGKTECFGQIKIICTLKADRRAFFYVVVISLLYLFCTRLHAYAFCDVDVNVNMRLYECVCGEKKFANAITQTPFPSHLISILKHCRAVALLVFVVDVVVWHVHYFR